MEYHVFVVNLSYRYRWHDGQGSDLVDRHVYHGHGRHWWGAREHVVFPEVRCCRCRHVHDVLCRCYSDKSSYTYDSESGTRGARSPLLFYSCWVNEATSTLRAIPVAYPLRIHIAVFCFFMTVPHSCLFFYHSNVDHLCCMCTN